MQTGGQESTEKVLVQSAGKLNRTGGRKRVINMTVIVKVEVVRFGECLTVHPMRQISVCLLTTGYPGTSHSVHDVVRTQ